MALTAAVRKGPRSQALRNRSRCSGADGRPHHQRRRARQVDQGSPRGWPDVHPALAGRGHLEEAQAPPRGAPDRLARLSRRVWGRLQATGQGANKVQTCPTPFGAIAESRCAESLVSKLNCPASHHPATFPKWAQNPKVAGSCGQRARSSPQSGLTAGSTPLRVFAARATKWPDSWPTASSWAGWSRDASALCCGSLLTASARSPVTGTGSRRTSRWWIAAPASRARGRRCRAVRPSRRACRWHSAWSSWRRVAAPPSRGLVAPYYLD